jgi:hypothetical protein
MGTGKPLHFGRQYYIERIIYKLYWHSLAAGATRNRVFEKKNNPLGKSGKK